MMNAKVASKYRREKARTRSPRKTWLAKRYGKSTFWSRWGAWIGVGIFLAIFPIFAAGRLPAYLLPEWQVAYITTVAPILSLLVLVGCFLFAILKVIDRPRITLVELMLLIVQVSGLTLFLLHSGLIENFPAKPILRYGLLLLCQALYVAGGARIRVRQWSERASGHCAGTTSSSMPMWK